jgi:hypothetical protein
MSSTILALASKEKQINLEEDFGRKITHPVCQ